MLVAVLVFACVSPRSGEPSISHVSNQLLKKTSAECARNPNRTRHRHILRLIGGSPLDFDDSPSESNSKPGITQDRAALARKQEKILASRRPPGAGGRLRRPEPNAPAASEYMGQRLRPPADSQPPGRARAEATRRGQPDFATIPRLFNSVSVNGASRASIGDGSDSDDVGGDGGRAGSAHPRGSSAPESLGAELAEVDASLRRWQAAYPLRSRSRPPSLLSSLCSSPILP